VLGNGHFDADGRIRPETQIEGADGERAAVTLVGGYRLITLDSLMPGKGYGEISHAQLSWLCDVLTEPAPHDSVLAFHHPLVDLGGPDSPLFHTLHARDPYLGRTAYEIDGGELEAVIAGLGPVAYSTSRPAGQARRSSHSHAAIRALASGGE